jgi:hypothetical protein
VHLGSLVATRQLPPPQPFHTSTPFCLHTPKLAFLLLQKTAPFFPPRPPHSSPGPQLALLLAYYDPPSAAKDSQGCCPSPAPAC